MKQEIIQKAGSEAYAYVSGFVNLESEDTLLLATTNPFNLLNHGKKVKAIVNFSKVNNIRFINKFFEAVNQQLENGDSYIGCFETFTAKRRRHWLGKLPVFSAVYGVIEFVFHRVFPKLWGFKKVYFAFTRGRNRLLSKAEVLGRLVCCGFEIVEYNEINRRIYFVVKKTGSPAFDMKPSYGPIYKMPRIGKNGKIIHVYKFRTMHPYSEYLQDYVLNRNGYAQSGKPANDFRLTPWGKFLRRYWLDELPQLFNILKGDMKLVGIRPVGERYFQDIPDDLKAMRLSQKPGCIPPYVALNKASDVQSVQDAERHYLKEKIQSPFTTDIRYLFKALFVIVFRKKRSA
jgi:lipopolysaccharide/colanic/teichoic acid biosynthesis glycosyltransferase